MQSFTTQFTVEQTPEQAFAAITDVRAWWSGNIEGVTDEPGAEFTYRYQDIHYSKQKITELIPAQLVVWQVLDAYLNFTDDPREWVGSEITFDITPGDDGTVVQFSHIGLVPEIECYEKCSAAWGYYINTSLKQLITNGEGKPNPSEGRKCWRLAVACSGPETARWRWGLFDALRGCVARDTSKFVDDPEDAEHLPVGSCGGRGHKGGPASVM